MTDATFALATSLIGFRTSTLRVRVIDRRDGCVWVITADLIDVGTRLVLDPSQVEELPDYVTEVTYRHKDGLVWIR